MMNVAVRSITGERWSSRAEGARSHDCSTGGKRSPIKMLYATIAAAVSTAMSTAMNFPSRAPQSCDAISSYVLAPTWLIAVSRSRIDAADASPQTKMIAPPSPSPHDAMT
eukprot:Amastigsp_a686952_2.p2 type:complete len:110 gc:universal Amastigsp_a686952_2:426-97(-)